MKTVCGIVGSLRKGSYNRGLMMAAIDVAFVAA
jgi:NAD(P)H-dependent FMN reductase